MTSTILDTRQYKVEKKLLYRSAKKVIAGQGWTIREDINDALIAMIRGVDGSTRASLTVTISGNRILVRCGPECKKEDYLQSKSAVDRFFQSLEELLSSAQNTGRR